MSHTPSTKVWAGPLALLIAVALATGSSAQQQERDDDPRDEERFEEEFDADEQDFRREADRDEAFDRDEQFDRQQWEDARMRDRDEPLDRREHRAERQPIDDADRREEAGLGISITRDDRPGVVVGRVFRDSPAAQMGLRQGDRITHVNDEPVRTGRDLVSIIREMQPGEEIELDIVRGREEYLVRGELETYEEAFPRERAVGRAPLGPETGRAPWGREMARDPRSVREADPRRLQSLERQVERLNRELQELRFAIQELRRGQPQWDRETAARYEEYETDRWDGVRQDERWRDDRQRDPRFRDDRGFRPTGPRMREMRGIDRDTPGGATGQQRLRPGTN